MRFIVEGTPVNSFRLALIIAQLLADADRCQVPIVRVASSTAVVRIIEPRA